jgi:uncharacterized membrane protein
LVQSLLMISILLISPTMLIVMGKLRHCYSRSSRSSMRNSIKLKIT